MRRRIRFSRPIQALLLGSGAAGLLLLLVAQNALPLPIVSEVHVDGVGWLSAAQGEPLPQEVIDRARNGHRMTLQERKDAAAQDPSPILLKPFADSGDPEVIAQLKRDALDDLAGGLALTRGRTLPSDYHEVEARIASASALPQQLAILVRSEQLAATDPADTIYSDTKVTADDWRGVKIDGDRAVALVHGTQEYFLSDDNRWVTEPKHWQLDLVDEDGRWKLDNVIITNPTQACAPDC